MHQSPVKLSAVPILYLEIAACDSPTRYRSGTFNVPIRCRLRMQPATGKADGYQAEPDQDDGGGFGCGCAGACGQEDGGIRCVTHTGSRGKYELRGVAVVETRADA